jgi:adenosylcobinamide-GDP ribazoletransferase
MDRVLVQIRSVLSYLTILPVGASGRLSEEESGRLPAFYPLAGLALGLILFLAARLLAALGAPGRLSAALLVALLVILTRGFHLDGLADSLDALLSQKSREEKLAIMKDPHLGSFGVTAIVLDLLLRVELLAALLARPDWAAPLILFPVWGRLASSTVSAFSRYAKAGGGLSFSLVERSGFPEFLIAFGITLALSLPFGIPPFLTALVAFLASIAFIQFWERKMLGVTGDILGATLEITEILCLLFFVLVF